jgi:hypothetical protein
VSNVLEAVIVPVVVAVVLGLAGWLIYRLFSLRVISASAKVCQDPHFYLAYGDSRNLIPPSPPHIDVELQLAARLRLAVTVLPPIVTARQGLGHGQQDAVTLTADGKPADIHLRLSPPKDEALIITTGDWLRLKLPLSSGGGPRPLRLRVG